MDNQEFDKLFSDQLQEEHNFGFRESDWEEVAARLSADRRRKPIWWWRWGLGLLLLGLIGLSAYFYYQLKNTKGALSELHTKVTKIKEEAKTAEHIIVDTIRIKDTVIQKIPSTVTYTSLKIERPNVSTISKSNQLSITNNTAPLSQEVVAEENPESEIVTDLLPEIELKADSLVMTKTEKERYYLDIYQFPVKKKGIKDRLKIGFTNAVGLTQTPADDSLAWLQGLDEKRLTFDIGLQAEWLFTKRLSVLAGINYSYIGFKVSAGLDRYGGYYGIDDFTEYVKISQTAIHYRLGFKYLHGDYQKWRPFAGLLLHAQSSQIWTSRQKFVPDFMEGQTVTTKTRIPDFRLNALEPVLGFEYRISKTFSWQMEAWYRYHFTSREDQFYSFMGIRNTIFYHF